MRLNHYYLALDPGHQTGWAVLHENGEFAAGEASYERAITDAEDTAMAAAVAKRPLILAVERANVNSNKGGRGIIRSLSWEMETIGCLKHFGRRFGHTCTQYNKSDSAHVAPDAMLKQLGWWHEGGDGHARDAARILAMAVRQYDLDYWHQLVIDKGVLRD